MRHYSLIRSARVGLVALAVAGSFACGDKGTDGESAQTPSPLPRNSLPDLQAFGELLTQYYSSEFDPPENVDVLVSRVEFVAVGRLESIVDGRKEYLGGCSADQCPSDRDAILYASYANLDIAPLDIVSGTLSQSEPNIYVEMSWPNNLDLRKLQDIAPTGARVMVIGNVVRDAVEMSGPLIKAGIAAMDGIRENLITVADFGLIFETDEGSTALPLVDCIPLSALVKDRDRRLERFDEAEQTISDAVKR